MRSLVKFIPLNLLRVFYGELDLSLGLRYMTHRLSMTARHEPLRMVFILINHQLYGSKLFVPHSFIANQIRTVYLIVQALVISKITVPPSLGQQQQHHQQRRLHGRYILIARQRRRRRRPFLIHSRPVWCTYIW